MADGTIPALQRERLEGLGRWLAINGEAIFGTRPWVVAEGRTAGGVGVRFTKRENSLYAVLLDAPGGQWVALQGLRAADGTTVTLLGHEEPLVWEQRGEALTVVLPPNLPPSPAYALAISPPPQATHALRAGSPALSIDSKLREILEDETGKAVLQVHVAAMLASPQIEMAMGLSLKQIAPFAPTVLTPEVLEAIDRELKSI